MSRLHDLINLNFKLGLRHGEILNLLSLIDEINISICTLMRIFRCMGLYHRKNESDLIEVALFLIY